VKRCPYMEPMRNLAMGVIVSAMLLAACAEQSITQHPAENTQGNGQQEEQQADPARIGDAITLAGNSNKLEMEVKPIKLVYPARPPDRFTKPSKGKVFAAIQLELRNVGSVNYNDSPANGAILVDSKGQQYTASILGLQPDLGAPKIAPADQRLGYITFEVPNGTTLRLFQFTLDSGFGPETGEWLVK
jgi:hypothetical protein